jgi:ribosomal protein L7/L12
VQELARDPSRKIQAIKLYREQTGAGLKEAKEAVESFIESGR